MAYRNGNYTAFYVAEPFAQNNLGAHSSPDFRYYHTLQAWKSSDSFFPFCDSHNKNYNVRDGSNWDYTLKPRLRERLRNSKNIILFLSSNTRASQALTEEIEYGIEELGLPVIAVYPEFDPILSSEYLNPQTIELWKKLPTFYRLMNQVPVVHVPFTKDALEKALNNNSYSVHSKTSPGNYKL